MIRLHVFGVPEVHLHRKVVRSFRTSRIPALLLFLARQRRRVATRAQICEALWPETNDTAARQSLRQTILLVKKLDPNLIQTTGQDIVELGAEVSTDWEEASLWHRTIQRQDTSGSIARARTRLQALIDCPIGIGIPDDWVHEWNLDWGASTADLGNGSLPVPRLRVAPLDEKDEFFGRTGELSQLVSLLEGTHLPWITITGIGGIGKSALLRKVANRTDLPCILLDASGMDEHVPGLNLLARALEIVSHPQSLFDKVRETLDSYPEVVLLLDSIDLITDRTRLYEALGRIQAVCPHVRVLAASRLSCEVENEVTVNLGPLSEEDAIHYFTAMMVLSNGAFSEWTQPEVKSLTDELDRVPLALRWAATELSHLPPENFLQRIRSTDSPIHKVLSWSWDRLGVVEKEFLLRLNLFSSDIPVDWVREDLESSPRLVAGGWLRTTPGLESRHVGIAFDSIRDFLSELEPPSAKREIWHATIVAEALYHHAFRMIGPLQPKQLLWFESISHEWERSFDVLWDAREYQHYARLVCGCYTGCLHLGMLDRFRYRIEKALSVASELPTSIRALLFARSGAAFRNMGFGLKGVQLFKEALEIADPTEDVWAFAYASTYLGASFLDGDPEVGIQVEQARFHLEKALSAWRSQNEPLWACHTEGHMVFCSQEAGDLATARSLLQDLIPRYAQIGSPLAIATYQLNLAKISSLGGDIEAADKECRVALDLFEEHQSFSDHQFALLHLAHCRYRLGRYEDAVRLLALFRRRGRGRDNDLPARLQEQLTNTLKGLESVVLSQTKDSLEAEGENAVSYRDCLTLQA